MFWRQILIDFNINSACTKKGTWSDIHQIGHDSIDRVPYSDDPFDALRISFTNCITLSKAIKGTLRTANIYPKLGCATYNICTII